MKVLITGGAGFIGSHLTERLISRGADVVFGLCNKYRKQVLLASTSEVYGKNLDVLGGETTKLGEEAFRLKGSTKNHRWAYANTKSMEEFLAFAYFRQYRMPVVVVRFFNTVGPRQTGTYGMVVPTFIQQALAGEPMTIFGTGDGRARATTAGYRPARA